MIHSQAFLEVFDNSYYFIVYGALHKFYLDLFVDGYDKN